MDFEEKIVSVSQGSIPCLSCGPSSASRRGTVPTMLFLHGGIAMPRAYAPLLTLLSQHFHVIAPTHPGHGDAFSLPSDWRLAQFVDVYTAFLQEAKVVPDVVVGHSLGATVGLLLATKNIGKQLIAMDPAGLPFHITAADFLKARAKEVRELLSRRNRKQVQDALSAVGAVVHTVVRHPEDIPWLWQQAPTWDIAKELESIHVPVSLFWGEKDGIVPLTVGQKMQILIPKATLTVFPKRGHNYAILEPEFTYAQIMKMCDANIRMHANDTNENT